MSKEEYKYWAFVVCGQKDRHWAAWLQKELPKYAVPAGAADDIPGLEASNHVSPIFIEPNSRPDQSELPESLVKELFLARHLIVICSPNTANAEWCNDAIRFYKYIGRGESIIPIIASGEPNAEDATEAFPHALKHQVDADGKITDQEDSCDPIDVRGGKGEREVLPSIIVGRIFGQEPDVPAEASAPPPEVPMPEERKPRRKSSQALPLSGEAVQPRPAKGKSRVLMVLTALATLTFAALSIYLIYELDKSGKALDAAEAERMRVQADLELTQKEKNELSDELSDTQDKLLTAREANEKLHRENDQLEAMRRESWEALNHLYGDVALMVASSESADDPRAYDVLKDTEAYFKRYLELQNSLGDKAMLPEMAASRRQIALYQALAGDARSAVDPLRSHIKAMENRLVEFPDASDAKQMIAENQFFLSRALSRSGSSIDAVKMIDNAVGMYDELYAKGLKEPQFWNLRASMLQQKLAVMKDSEDETAYATVLSDRVNALKRMYTESQDQVKADELAKAYRELAQAWTDAGDSSAVENNFQQAIEYYERMAGSESGDYTYGLELGDTYGEYAEAIARGNTLGATAVIKKQIQVLDDVLSRAPNAPIRRKQANAQSRLGDLLLSAGDRDGARMAYQDANGWLGRLVELYPEQARLKARLAENHRRVAILRMKSAPSEALASLDTVIKLYDSLKDTRYEPESLELAALHGKRGDLLGEIGSPADALDAYQSEQAIIQGEVTSNADSLDAAWAMAGSMDAVAKLYENQNYLDTALEWRQAARAQKEYLKTIDADEAEVAQALQESDVSIRRLSDALGRDPSIPASTQRSGYSAAQRPSVESSAPESTQFTSANASGEAIRVTDRQALEDAVGQDREVVGRVRAIDYYTGDAIQLRFWGNREFAVSFDREKLRDFTRHFNEDIVGSLVTRSVRVRGIIKGANGRTFIQISEPIQIEVTGD